MSSLHRLNSMLSSTAAAAAIAYCAAEPAPRLGLFSIVCIVGAWFAARSGITSLPRMLTGLLVLAAIARVSLQVMADRQQENLVSYLAQFLILVMLIKLFDRRTPRDDGQLLTLTLFIVIGALLTSNALPVGVLALAYAPLATATAMLQQIQSGAVRAADAAIASGAPLPPSALTRPLLGAPGRRRFIGIVATAVVMSLTLSVLGFLAAPRGFGQGALGRFGQTHSGATVGFTDEIRLGSTGLLDPNNTTPVMDVLATDGSNRNIGAPTHPLYLRGSVRDRWNQSTRSWDTSSPLGREGTVPVQANTTFLLAGILGAGAGTNLDIAIRNVPGDRATYLFTQWPPVSIEFSASDRITPPGPPLVLQRTGRSGRLEYRIVTRLLSYTLGATPARPETFADGPISVLARETAGLAENDPLPQLDQTASIAAKIEQRLRSSYTYTLEMKAPPAGEDPIEYFLFDRKAGHCEYFASAMVAMCQSLGIPSRIVSGYLAAEFNPVTGRYTVRESNAHAWAEVYVGNGRWRTFDPSPPADIERLHRPAEGLLAKLRSYYEAIEFSWNQSVVLFDEQSRSDLLTRVRWSRLSPGRLGERLAAAARDAGAKILSGDVRGWIEVGGWLAIAAGVVGVIVLATRQFGGRVLARLRRAGRRGLDADDAAVAAQTAFYRRVLRSLSRAGAPKPEGRTALAHASAIRPSLPDLATVLEEAAVLYHQVRFARRGLTPEQVAVASTLAARALEAARRPRTSGPQSPGR